MPQDIPDSSADLPQGLAPSEVIITPEFPTTNDTLTCVAAGTPNGVTLFYTWLKRDTALPGQTSMTLDASATEIGDLITCAVSATNGTDTSDPVRSDPVEIEDPSFRTETWRVVSPEPTVSGDFGTSVSLDGDRAVISAPGEACAATDCDSGGVVYVYERSVEGAWDRVARLRSSNAGAFDNFGVSVSIDGDRLVVGAPGEDGCAEASETDDGCDTAGAAYIFERGADGTWSQVARLKASNAESMDNFGRAVSLSEDKIIVGANSESSCPSGLEASNDCLFSGAAYVFERDAGGVWAQVALLKGSNTESDDDFGYTVSLSGDRALVGARSEDGCFGAPETDNGCRGAGAAYLFERGADGAWSQVAHLKASNVDFSDNFGVSVSLSGDRAIIGANGEAGCVGMPETDNDCGRAGAAYIFERDAQGVWGEVARLKTFEAFPYATHFGRDVAMSGDRVVIGADNASACEGFDCRASGLVYIYERDIDGAWASKRRYQVKMPQTRDYFGGAVSVSGSRVLIGAVEEDSCGDDLFEPCGYSGAAYFFD